MTGANGEERADLFSQVQLDRAIEGMARGLSAPVAAIDCPHCKGTGKIPADTFGKRLRALRLERGLTTAQVSEAVKKVISASNLSQVENDANPNPKTEAIRALAAFYGVRPGWLLDGDPPE